MPHPIVAALLLLSTVVVNAVVDRPQYICLNAIGVGQLPTQAQITATLTNLSGVQGSADGTRRLCMSEQWSVLGNGANTTKMVHEVDQFLALSLANDLPVSISIDATQWWENAEHIWNWWNTSRTSTYNPRNVYNVEWTGWSPDNATKIAWRNWGSQFRITKAPGVYTPPPNFASPAFREAAAEAMLPLVRRIAAWYKGLPVAKQYLLAYVRSTQELWQGTNYWYYKDGNALVGKNVSNDPHCGPTCAAQLGYAAVCAAGGVCSGNITVPQLDATINSYCDFANGLLLGAGIPRSRVMCHTSFGKNPTTPPPKGKATPPLMNTPATAITASGAPGWSMYVGSSPMKTIGGFELASSLDAIDDTAWGAPEWMPFNLLAGKGSVRQWTTVYEDILAFRNNRLVVMQNWDSLWRSTPVSFSGITALATVVATPPACLVDAATELRAVKLNATAYTLQWQQGGVPLAPLGTVAVESQRVLASNVAALLPSGALAAPTLLDVVLGAGASSAALTLKADASLRLVRWQVVARGCRNTQQVTGDVEMLVL